MVDVSIIVPVYNSINTINRCVESLIKQTLTNIEVILVDDCSTDDSLIILKEWERLCSDKIKVFKTEANLGPGGARNLGVSVAKGKYLGFVDSDDYIAPNMYRALLDKAEETGYDVIDSGMYDEKNDKAILFTGDDCIGELTSDKRQKLIVLGGYCVTKIFKRELFNDVNYRMRNNCGLEDADFITYLFATINTIGTVKEIFYCYTNATNSLSKPNDRKRYYSNILDAMNAIWGKVHTLDNYLQIIDAVEYELMQLYVYGIINSIEGYLDSKGSEYLEQLIQLRKLRMKAISSTDVYNNKYVRRKIESTELEFAKKNDEDPEMLLTLVYKK